MEASSAQTGPFAQTAASVTEYVTNPKCFSDKKCVDKEMYGRNNAENYRYQLTETRTSITLLR